MKNTKNSAQHTITFDFCRPGHDMKYKSAFEFHWAAEFDAVVNDQVQDVLGIEGIWDPSFEGILGDGQNVPECYMMPATDAKAQRQLKVCINTLAGDILIYRDTNCNTLNGLCKILTDIVNGVMKMTGDKHNKYAIEVAGNCAYSPYEKYC